MRLWLVFAMLVAGCQTGSNPAPTSTTRASPLEPAPVSSTLGPNICHIVICWMKHPGDSEAARKLVDVSKSFRQIPGVIDVKCGSVVKSPRPVVDSTYDIAVVITFDNAESLKAYQTHPVHVKATREVLAPLTDRILIYDFIEE